MQSNEIDKELKIVEAVRCTPGAQKIAKQLQDLIDKYPSGPPSDLMDIYHAAMLETMKLFAIVDEGDDLVEAYSSMMDRGTSVTKGYLAFPIFSSKSDAEEAAKEFERNDRPMLGEIRYSVKEVTIQKEKE